VLSLHLNHQPPHLALLRGDPSAHLPSPERLDAGCSLLSQLTLSLQLLWSVADSVSAVHTANKETQPDCCVLPSQHRDELTAESSRTRWSLLEHPEDVLTDRVGIISEEDRGIVLFVSIALLGSS
jgi:hypothetical protein